MAQYLIYPILKMSSFFLSALPIRVRIRIGRGLGWLIRKIKFRQKVIQRNIELMYPKLEPNEKKQLERDAYSHLGKLASEIPLIFSGLKKFADKNSKLIGSEHWKKAHASQKGVIFLSSHVGNWEIMAATGALAGMDLMMVTKQLKPAWFHKRVEAGRKRALVQATYEPRTVRDIFRHLKRNGTIGMVLDQYAGPPVGYRVPFFGQWVGTSSALATLVKRTGAVVLPVVNYRKADGTYVVEVGKSVPWIESELEREIAVNTANYAKILEQQVRNHPEQWLWTHRRFKGKLGPIDENEWKKRPRS